MLGSGAMVVHRRGHRPAGRLHQRAAVLPRRVLRQVRALPGRLDQGARPAARDARLRSRAGRRRVGSGSSGWRRRMRKTSICGLGQVALGPVASVLGLDKGGAAARDQPRPERRPGAAGPVSGREFFTARTVAEARAGFRPAHRHRGRDGPAGRGAAPGAGRAGRRAAALPGFDRSTVDGFAVRAADTFGASDGLPSYLDLLGAVRMGAEPDVAVRPGGCVADADRGGAAARRGRGGHGRVHRRDDARHDRGDPAGRRRAPGWCGPTRTSPPAPRWSPGGRPLRAAELGLLAAAGVTDGDRPHATPGGDRLHRRRGGPAGHRERSRPGRSGTRPPRRWPGWSPTRAARRSRPASSRTSRARWRRRCAGRLGGPVDLVVISAGSSVGARDETTGAVAALGDRLVPRPGDQARQADAAGRVRGRPGHRPARQPAVRAGRLPARRRAAGLVAGRLHGAAAGAVDPGPAVPRPRLGEPGGSTSCRSRRRSDGVATPLFGPSALLSVLTRADGYVLVPGAGHRPGRGHRGRGDPVPMSAESPFISDVPAAAALAAWRDGPRRGRLPGPGRGRPAAGGRGRRPGHRRRRSGRPGPRRRSTRPPWTASRSAPPTPSARATPARSLLPGGAFDVVDTGDPLPAGYDAVIMREHVHRTPAPGRRAARGRPAVPARPLDRRGHQRHRAAAAGGPPAAPRRRRRGAAAGVVELAVRRAAPGRRRADRRRDPPDRRRARARRDRRHELAHARRAGPRGRLRDRGDCRSCRRPGRRSPRRCGRRPRGPTCVILIAGSSAGRDDYTARVVAAAGTLAVHGVAVRPGHPVVLGTVGTHRRCSARPASRCRRRSPSTSSPRRCWPSWKAPRRARRPVTTARLARKLPSAHRHGRLGPGPAGPGRRRRRGDPAAARRRRAHLARPRRRAARGPGRHGGPPRRRARSRSSCCAGWPRSTGRSSRSARTTSCSTWPPPGCAPPTR